ncbi:MAG: hypothetical protein WCB68_17525 [Pyrinomonadaceae bacterium]
MSEDINQNKLGANHGNQVSKYTQAVSHALTNKQITSICPACPNTKEWEQWELVPAPVACTLLSTEGNLVPAVCLICESCGHMRLFAMIALGIKMEPKRIITPP